MNWPANRYSDRNGHLFDWAVWCCRKSCVNVSRRKTVLARQSSRRAVHAWFGNQGHTPEPPIHVHIALSSAPIASSLQRAEEQRTNLSGQAKPAVEGIEARVPIEAGSAPGADAFAEVGGVPTAAPQDTPGAAIKPLRPLWVDPTARWNL